ncbi:MAG TPA: hypothetical protein VK149_04265 [Sideroxyarcus sp.]|nr:hypothetical protein [Sideroxyarcus sp.]
METYTRHIKIGDSEGYVGAEVMLAITRPFTPAEDAVFLWLLIQDKAHLLDMVPLADGRDYIILRREYETQSMEAAFAERRRFRDAMTRLPKQHVSQECGIG